ncbi:hypothetical protein D3C76_1008850 [compost metagenome]
MAFKGGIAQLFANGFQGTFDRAMALDLAPWATWHVAEGRGVGQVSEAADEQPHQGPLTTEH